MDTMCKIKLGSVNNLTDARYGAAAGAEWIGFCFDTANALYTSPVQAQAISGWLSGPVPVAEFAANQALEEMEDIIRLLGFEWIQIADAALLHHFEGSDINIILEVSTPGELSSIINTITPEVKAILVKNIAVQDVAKISQQNIPILFDVEGLDANALVELKTQNPYGINISGGFETAPGIRDFDEMDAVFRIFGEG